MQSRWMTMVGVILLSLALVMPALAAPGGPGSELRPQREGRTGDRPRVAGEVIAVEEESLLITTERGELTLYVDTLTRFIIPEVESPGLEDVEVGNFVLAAGEREGDGLRVRVLVVRPAKPLRLRGEVESVGSEGFTLLTEAGTVEVIVDEITRFRLPKLEQPGLTDLEVGRSVVVVGQAVDEGVLARLVSVPRPKEGKVRGTVTAVGATSLTVERGAGHEMTFTVTDETVILVPEVAEPALEDVEVGAVVEVRAHLVEGEPSALHIAVIPSEAALLVGEVVEVQGGVIQVQTRLDQIIAVETDESTRFFIADVEEGGLEAVEAGDPVHCGGKWDADGGFLAWVVRVPADQRPAEVSGLILSVADENFRLGTRYGIVSVSVTAETHYRFPGEPDFGFENLEEGHRVHVHGLHEGDSLLARQIMGRER